jgi:hypothetical protein
MEPRVEEDDYGEIAAVDNIVSVDHNTINSNNANNVMGLGGARNYFSINSISIMPCYHSRNDASDNQSVSNVFSKKKFIFFYFEFHHFIFWAKEQLRNIYPEINLIMVLEINDNKLTQEKVYFTRSDEFTKHIPMKARRDINKPVYRIVKPLEYFGDENPFKIAISFYTYTNHKLLTICVDEIYLKYSKGKELTKYTMYQNVYMKHYNKKIGNNFFNFAFKVDEINPNDLEPVCGRLLDQFYVKLFLTG